MIITDVSLCNIVKQKFSNKIALAADQVQTYVTSPTRCMGCRPLIWLEGGLFIVQVAHKQQIHIFSMMYSYDTSHLNDVGMIVPHSRNHDVTSLREASNNFEISVFYFMEKLNLKPSSKYPYCGQFEPKIEFPRSSEAKIHSCPICASRKQRPWPIEQWGHLSTKSPQTTSFRCF